MASKYFSNKLKNLRLKAGYTQKEVYEHFKIPQSTFSSWEVGKSEPSGEMLIKLCEFYKCDMIREFSSDEDLTYVEWKIIDKYRSLDSHGKKIVDLVLNEESERSTSSPVQIVVENEQQPKISTRLVNYYYKLASAGNGQIVFDTPPTEKIQIPSTPEYQKVDYAIGVNGNSMEPVYFDSDILLIEVTEDIDPGENGIFIVDGESYVKKMGDAELISLNPRYKNIPLTENSKCMGRVVGKL